MINVYAKIENGIVVNMQVAQSTDVFDPSFTWIVITTQTCIDGSPIQIGCTTTDNINFTPPTGY
jgi:hypothetical protein